MVQRLHIIIWKRYILRRVGRECRMPQSIHARISSEEVRNIEIIPQPTILVVVDTQEGLNYSSYLHLVLQQDSDDNSPRDLCRG